MTDWTGNGATFGTETSAIPVLPGPRCSPLARHAGIRQILAIAPAATPDPASTHPALPHPPDPRYPGLQATPRRLMHQSRKVSDRAAPLMTQRHIYFAGTLRSGHITNRTVVPALFSSAYWNIRPESGELPYIYWLKPSGIRLGGAGAVSVEYHRGKPAAMMRGEACRPPTGWVSRRAAPRRLSGRRNELMACGSAEPAEQVVVLVPERAGQVAAEGAEVLGDERGLSLPCFGIDGEQEVEVVLVDV